MTQSPALPAPGARGDESHMVLFGRDGWLFLQADSNDVVGQHTGAVTLRRRDRYRWRSLLRRRAKLRDRLDFAWAFEIVPDKQALYPEFLPPEIRQVERRPVHELLEIAHSVGVPAHYLLDDLRAAKSEGELYPKTDTHWNQRGAFAAYRGLAERLADQGVAMPVVDASEVRWRELDAAQDLGTKLTPKPTSRDVRADLVSERGTLVFDNRIRGHGRVLIFEQANSDLPSAVLFGESYSMQMLVFLKESFRRLAFVYASTMSPQIIEAEQPDVVLSLPVERFLIRPPFDDRRALQSLREVALEKAAVGDVYFREDYFTAPLPHDHDRLDHIVTATFPWLG